MHHCAGTPRPGSTLTAFILPRRVRNLHMCRFLQPYHGLPNPRIRLAPPLDDDYYRVFSTLCSIVICHPHAAYYHPSEFVGRI
ncbi:hypothetical protein TNCV_2652071 [Trichonephila clavipes]|nr:hypothetical protein TNCV_2652071 [Trichonephila clavipes]